jgi:transposase
VAQAYSNDLRRKLLEAHARGEGTLRVLAERFSVSLDWAYKISAERSRTGSMDRAVQVRRGPRSEVDTVRIAALLEKKADLTLPELQQQLIAETGRRTSVPHLWRVVRKMGFRLKKSRSTPPNETAKPTGSGARRS